MDRLFYQNLDKMSGITEILLWCDFDKEVHCLEINGPEELKYDKYAGAMFLAVRDLASKLTELYQNRFTEELTDESIQYWFYEIGKAHYGTDKKDLFLFFKHLYFLLFRERQGQRWGAFVRSYGIPEFIELMLWNTVADPLWVMKEDRDISFSGFNDGDFMAPTAADLEGITIPTGCVILKHRINERLYYRSA